MLDCIVCHIVWRIVEGLGALTFSMSSTAAAAAAAAASYGFHVI